MSDNIKPHIRLQKEFITECLKYIAADELGKSIKPEHLTKLTDRPSINQWLSNYFNPFLTDLLTNIYEDHQEYFENLK